MMPIKCLITGSLKQRSNLLISTFLNRKLAAGTSLIQNKRGKQDNSSFSSNTLFHPVPVKEKPDDTNVGIELTGVLDKCALMNVMVAFAQRKEVTSLALEYGLNNDLRTEALKHFRQYCLTNEALPADLHVILSDIIQGAGNITDIFPYFIRYAKRIFPHLDCLDDLKKISDLRSPANWYPIARSKTRKIIFHAGPTNSGKTFHALERFMSAKTGVYCGPLKLLATEVFNKCNDGGTPCDLVTGEERKYASDEQTPANHISCSVEMVNINNTYEVAVIDEVQLMRDAGRGWAWTRALLGIPADEVHLCGESAAIDLVKSICMTTGETVEVRNYKRLTELVIEEKALVTLNNVRPGDCIVCFNKNDIFSVSRAIEYKGLEVAVIYGSLPPGTKLAQAAKFNDPSNPCKILIATNAIGMGLNLHIRRIIFFSLNHPMINEKGEKEMDTISVSSALQIAGRAGRYGTQWERGYVTTYKNEDLPTLNNLLRQKPDILTKAGLHPTADQIELYGYHLPHATLSNLMDIFVALCTVDDSLYFMCNVDDFKFLASMIQHVPIPLRARYIFCCAPINRKMPFVCTMFLKFARQYSKNDKISFTWLCENIGWPFGKPKSILDLIHFESVFDVLDLYLWLSYRFVDLFPDAVLVRDIQKELDQLIQAGVVNLMNLLKNTETGGSNGEASVSHTDKIDLPFRKQHFIRDSPQSRRSTHNMPKGKLTERLLAQGLLTSQMVQELQKEWSNLKKKK